MISGHDSFSALRLLREGLRGGRGWRPLWQDRKPDAAYDVVIIGGGGHGLATAYYLAARHGVRSVAVIERGWIGGGATGRNTTNIRSDYLYPESSALYDRSLRLYEGLSRELGFNLMLSQRGWITLAHSPHDLELLRHRANAMRWNGVDAEILDRSALAKAVPLLDLSPQARFPVLGGLLQPRGGTARHDGVAWGFARAADRLGVHVIQNCDATGFVRRANRIVAVETNLGVIRADKVALTAAGQSSVLAGLAGFRLPLVSMNLQAMVTEPLAPVLDKVLISPASGVYINQSDKGEIVMGGMLNVYASYRTLGNFSVVRNVVGGALVMLPALASVRLLRHWSGIVDVAPDSSPIIGKTPVDNVYVSCGWGTGGFKAIPVGGELLAYVIARDEPSDIAAPFGLRRFETGEVIDEGAASGIRH